MVLGHSGPLIGQDFDLSFARIDHGFDGEGHAFFEQNPCASVCRNAGLGDRHETPWRYRGRKTL